jgi:uncharacterized radical SAM superfamily Fe-S cluster-containing enzyme
MSSLIWIVSDNEKEEIMKIKKVEPITKIYKKTDLSKEDRRKFIKKVYLSWKDKREQDLMKNKVDLTI